jgi:hypothetical protein
MTEITNRIARLKTAPWKTIAVFALVGPPIGSMVGLMIVLKGKIISHQYDIPLLEAVQLFPLILMLGYICGLVPAILAAIGVIWWPQSHALRSPLARGAICGAVFSGLTAGSMIWFDTDRDYDPFVWMCLAAFMGAAAGHVCGWLSRNGVRG